MADLEYTIGGLNVNPNSLRFAGNDPHDASHKFVAEALDHVVSIYVAEEKRHMHIAGRFGIREERLVGGGSCYLNGDGQLVLNDCSGDYHGIPKEAARRFAELMIPELKKLGVEAKGIVVNPHNADLHSFWRENGFGSKQISEVKPKTI